MDAEVVQTQHLAKVQEVYSLSPFADIDKAQALDWLLKCLGLSHDEWEYLKRCYQKMTAMEQRCSTVEQKCNQTVQVCNTYTRNVKRWCCAANVLYSQPTVSNFSDNSLVKLNQVIEGLGGDFEDSFPVAPHKAIVLTHTQRPGYTPEKIGVDFSLANNGDNYLDLTVQFYIGAVNEDAGNSTKFFASLKAIGDEYDGNQFLNKNGTQIHLEFPPWENNPITIGSIERVVAVVRHTGAANNLTSASVRLHYSAKAWWALCEDSECR